MHCVRWVRRDRPTNRRRVCLARGHGIANREACERDSRHRRLAKVRARCVAKWRCSGWDRDTRKETHAAQRVTATEQRSDATETRQSERNKQENERKTGRKSDCIRLCERRSKGLKVRAAGRSTRVLGDSGEETDAEAPSASRFGTRFGDATPGKWGNWKALRRSRGFGRKPELTGWSGLERGKKAAWSDDRTRGEHRGAWRNRARGEVCKELRLDMANRRAGHEVRTEFGA
ncbi:hypothetical protein ERJ75_001705400 [Trypanosoma vivax]|nr:hypothetical protein ERJ75_001705400 [Trypanosoma vivax]